MGHILRNPLLRGAQCGLQILPDLILDGGARPLHGCVLLCQALASLVHTAGQQIELRCLSGDPGDITLPAGGFRELLFQGVDRFALLPQVFVILIGRLPLQNAAGAGQDLLLVFTRLAGLAQALVARFGTAQYVEILGLLAAGGREHGEAIPVCLDAREGSLEPLQFSLGDLYLLIVLGTVMLLHEGDAALLALVDQVVEFRQTLLPALEYAAQLMQVAQFGKLQLQAVTLHHLQQVMLVVANQRRGFRVLEPPVTLQVQWAVFGRQGELQVCGCLLQCFQVAQCLLVLLLRVQVGLQGQLGPREFLVAVRQRQQCFLYLRGKRVFIDQIAERIHRLLMVTTIDGYPAEPEQGITGPGGVQAYTAELLCGAGEITVKGKGIAGSDARFVAQDAQLFIGIQLLFDQRRSAAVLRGGGGQLLLSGQGGGEVAVAKYLFRKRQVGHRQ